MRKFVLVLSAATALAAGASERAKVGDQVTYADVAGTRWCATVRASQPGVATDVYLWVTIDAHPARAFAVPAAALPVGCPAGLLMPPAPAMTPSVQAEKR